ncbi:hypothetical protein DPMN_055470 [Dreissena polymorpha]|uniref:Uncharacterized protein n=1 Tax=Dreissena polymorpha TaxID=45954 RepID=A0A9D4CQ17_DREPO|nr:hypothetical protein DPMN_055470 [Dreissena polymorpha]
MSNFSQHVGFPGVISCIASCAAQNILRRFVFRTSPFERETRRTKRYTNYFATVAATHESLRDSSGDARYFARQSRRFTIYLRRYIAFWATYTRAIFRGIFSRVDSCIAQNIVRRRDCRTKYLVSLRVSCVALDERMARLYMALSGFRRKAERKALLVNTNMVLY